MNDDRLTRLYALSDAAKEMASETSALGKQARELLAHSTGLSRAGVEIALSECLEHAVGRSTLSGLVRRTPRARRAHVLLSANVFIAPFRAIALGLCQSPQVFVRASRRQPTLTELLYQASGEAFELVETLDVAAGDHVWAYGHDSTLADVARGLPPGSVLHAHGSGMGVAVFRESPGIDKAALLAAVEGLAKDVSLFDQRGCLSPRVVFVQGSRSFAETICNALVEALDEWEGKVPRGTLSPDEAAEVAWHEATMFYLGSCVRAGRGLVYLDPNAERVIVPPIGRFLHVTVTSDVRTRLLEIGDKITSVGLFNPGPLVGVLHADLGPRRYVDLGTMQTPAFDGPVDLRPSATGRLI